MWNTNGMKTLNRKENIVVAGNIRLSTNAEQHLRWISSWSFVWGVAISHFSSVIYVKRMLLWFSTYANADGFFFLHWYFWWDREWTECLLIFNVLATHLVYAHWNHLTVCFLRNAIRIVLPFCIALFTRTQFMTWHLCAWECDEFVYDAISKWVLLECEMRAMWSDVWS